MDNCTHIGLDVHKDTIAHRLISSLGVACEVIAPALIPRRAGVRVKTGPIDARNLARLHRAGELTPVRIPTPAEEPVRDLTRAREDLKGDRRVARKRIRSFLLRYGRRPPAISYQRNDTPATF